jgi:hypothetical protein
MLIATSEENLGNDASHAIGSNEVAVIDIATRQVISRSAAAQPVGSLMPIDEHVAVGFFEHPKLLSLRTGAVLDRWETIASGKQTSSIILNDVPIPPIAIDIDQRRFAVADAAGVDVVQISA